MILRISQRRNLQTHLSPRPLLVKQQSEELIAEGGRAEVPGTVVSRAVRVAATQSMRTDQSNHLLVIETHASEDSTDVLLVLRCIGQTSIRSASSNVLVLTARSPWDSRASRLLDGGDSTQSPQVRVGDPRELLCNFILERRGHCSRVSMGTYP